MAPGSFRFDRFVLDLRNRQLTQQGAPVDINARYLDALALLVRENGKLVSKERFLDDVWRGVPVTDEALTQCIRTLRKQLGDDAGSPRFIQTVPKHGYRFIAQVEWLDVEPASATVAAIVDDDRPANPANGARRVRIALLGTAGGGAAGAIGGLLYGFAGASSPDPAGSGGFSALLVLIALTTLVGVLGGAGVSFGIAAASAGPDRAWWRTIAGAAAGGLAVGACMRLLGLDAFSVLFGRSPGEITGALEGLVLGTAVGIGTWLSECGPGSPGLRRGTAIGAAAGGAGGLLVTLLNGRLMGGSLESLSRSFPDSRLNLDGIGQLFGEAGFGPVSRYVTSAAEGALFVAFVVAAIMVARKPG